MEGRHLLSLLLLLRSRSFEYQMLYSALVNKLKRSRQVNEPTENITQLLIELTNGKQNAVEDLLPLIYGELRSLAGNYLRRERSDHTLQPTALVHEAYLRLVDQTQVNGKTARISLAWLRR